MASPTLSRTPSSLFSPSSTHRRSHPNLQHLSLAPLTPKYPISASDYDAYFDPHTSNLHTSSSLSHIATLPSLGGILTNSPAHSRAGSRTRLRRKNKNSSVHIQAPDDLRPVTLSGALTSSGFGGQVQVLKQSRSRLRLLSEPSDDWLTQTGLALTSGSRESKGQLWLAQRDSSTSLHSPETGRTPMVSGRNTPNISRRGSRVRRNKGLAMTTTEEDRRYRDQENSELDLKVRPNWLDGPAQTEAEIAAELEGEMAGELDDDGDVYEETDEFFRDRYGMLDFTGQFDSSDDERQVRDAMRKKGFRMGKLFDNVIDVFLQMEGDEEEGGANLDAQEMESQEDGPPKDKKEKVVDSDGNVVEEETIEEAPSQPRSIWEDVRWFGRVVARTVAS